MSDTLQTLGSAKPGDILIVQYASRATKEDLEGTAKALKAVGVRFVFVPESLTLGACSAADIDRLEAAIRALKAAA